MPATTLDKLTVADLIKYLQSQPQDAIVAHWRHSDACLMQKQDIMFVRGLQPDSDGSIGLSGDTQEYLIFPGE